MTEASWGPEGNWRLWMGAGVLNGLVELIDQRLASPSGAAALGVVPWLTHPDVTRRLKQMLCCVVVDKEAAVTEALNGLHADGMPFPAEAILGFSEDMGPVDESGAPMVVDPGTPWPPRPESIGPVRVWGYTTIGRSKPLAHTKLLLLGKVARIKNYAWPEGGPSEYQEFIPELVWFGSANWTLPAASQHLEMGAFTTDPGFVQACFAYVSSVVLESEPLGSMRPTRTPEMQPVKFDDDAFADYVAEYGGIAEDDW